MGKKDGISRIVVEGLHEQFDVDIALDYGLNVIYGKNGRGKTTLLHILVNALELDFKRFSHLNFKKISITTFGGVVLDIFKDSQDTVRVLLDGAETSFFANDGALSAAETAALRNALGSRPVYLPAFRSVLERVRSDYTYNVRDPSREAEIEALTQAEHANLRQALELTRDPEELRAIKEEALVTARKTSQCRQWFGSFVPVVRYPSIFDVDEGLSSEWRNAQIKISRREQSMFADVFANVFRTVVGMDKNASSSSLAAETEESLLVSISKFLNDTDYQNEMHGPSAIYSQLSEAIEFLNKKNERDPNEVARSVLQLYVKTLSARKDERTKAFEASRDFEISINKFLDRKTLRIGDSMRPGRFRSVVTVGTDGGRAYGLGALSSGEKQILTMLYSATRSRFKSGIFLIDEPELSLHIDWQRQILAELSVLAPDNQIIACTHSPEVGADHFNKTQDFEPVMSKNITMDDLFDSLDHSEE